MSTETQRAQENTDALLQRILNAVEPVKPKRGFEIVCAIVLSLATTASAWCAYQSKLWGGAQMGRANAAVKAAREGAVNNIAAVQARAFDASMFIAYVQARFESNRTMETFLERRFRADFRPAVDAWLKCDPFNNASAPSTPFQMKEYVQKESAEMARQQAVAEEAAKSSRQARQTSDNYVLLTVLFASVLFFGGIARAFDSRRLRLVLAALAMVLFLATLAALMTTPICHE